MRWSEERYGEFVKKMETAYPEMFAGQRYGGFAVGEGWWHILEVLCKNIDSHIRWRNDAAKNFPSKYQHCPQVTVTQVKEKFGGLRFYYDGGDEYVSGLVTMAEAWADSSCEECGNPGIRRSGGWLKTLCDQHYTEREEKRRESHA